MAGSREDRRSRRSSSKDNSDHRRRHRDERRRVWWTFLREQVLSRSVMFSISISIPFDQRISVSCLNAKSYSLPTCLALDTAFDIVTQAIIEVEVHHLDVTETSRMKSRKDSVLIKNTTKTGLTIVKKNKKYRTRQSCFEVLGLKVTRTTWDQQRLEKLPHVNTSF